MTKQFIKIKKTTILLIFLFLTLGYVTFSQFRIQQYLPKAAYLPPPIYHPRPKVYYRPGDVLMDPYKPPLKDNKFYARHVGVPINIPTSTVDANYSCIGILTRMSGKEQILPLFGRPLHFGRNQWQYYAMSDKNNNIKLPISNAGKSCTSEYGCDNLSNGDTVYVEGFNDTFKATIYENNVPRYIPYIC